MAAAVGSAGAAMDAEFLKRTVGEPLSDALTSLVVAQPADPIEFIGEALLDFINRKEAESKVNWWSRSLVMAVFVRARPSFPSLDVARETTSE